jgi:hypothetical protein
MMMTKSTSGPSDQEWDESSVPVISERALARAHRTVRDFVRTYFPLHGVAPERVLDVWWLLVYVEGFVYQIDEENEAQCGPRRTTRPTTATTTTTLPPESTTGAVNLGDHRKPNPNFDPNADDADHRIDILTDRLQNSLERMNLSTWRGVLRSTTTTTSADAGAGAVTSVTVALYALRGEDHCGGTGVLEVRARFGGAHAGPRLGVERVALAGEERDSCPPRRTTVHRDHDHDRDHRRGGHGNVVVAVTGKATPSK